MSSTAENEIALAGPLQNAARIRRRELSARELVELYLRRIEALDPQLNAFRELFAEQALKQADAVDRGVVEDAGPLAGVPLAIKDDMPVKGHLMTRGSRSHTEPQTADAEPLRRLRAAGAIPLGITNVPELMLFPWTASAAAGVSRNPWDLSRTPGGSSGGSAAAVAAGLVAAAGGSDGGGSIRIPAACCGLVGMKPTRGRVSAQPLGQSWLGLSTYGALTRTVADSALLLDLMHGSLAGDQYPLVPPSGSFLEAARMIPPPGLRIATSRHLPFGALARLSADQRLAWEQTGRLLAELGHHVEEHDPDYGLAGMEFLLTYLIGAHESFTQLEEPSVAERSTRQLAAIGGLLDSPSRRRLLLRRRRRSTRRIATLWDSYDVLLTPGLASSALDARGAYGRSAPTALARAGSFMPWFPVFNLSGQPAISIPAGLGSDGLPLSVQLVARHGGEELLYSLAGQIEAQRPWAQSHPALAEL